VGQVIAAGYAGIVLDIDGVLCRGDEPVPGAAATLETLRERGIGIALVTNNASRTPRQVAGWLADLGITVRPEEVLTSPLAAARMIPAGTRCLVIGMAGLRQALLDRGAVLEEAPDEAEAVVVGFDHELVWDDLRRATLALHRGARFIGTNGDVTFPSAEGLWPGNGAVLAALEAASGRRAEIAGKPEPPLFRAAAATLPPGRLLMVGDRVETDILGAAALGWDTAVVLTGVADEAQARAAGATHVLESVADLLS
jgi:HAD superfamily hydrolase (TIGR01450 family)